VARVLRPAFRDGLAAARASGWRSAALALLAYMPVAAFGTLLGGALLVVGLALHVVVVLALVRVLACARREALPPLPQVDELGRRVAPPPRPGPPLTPEDRSAIVALRNAARLWRAALSITGLYLLAGLTGGLAAVALSGGKFAEYTPTTQLVAVLPLSALVTAFVALAPQRVALEGDPRVLVAAAHSVRVARTAYGTLLALTVAEPVVAAIGTVAVSGKHPPPGRVAVVAVVTVAAAAFVKVVTIAVGTEVYLAGPRLDLPLDPGVVQ
jgi:hypothetical protein